MAFFNRTFLLLLAQAASVVMACCGLAADPPGATMATCVVELFTS